VPWTRTAHSAAATATLVLCLLRPELVDAREGFSLGLDELPRDDPPSLTESTHDLLPETPPTGVPETTERSPGPPIPSAGRRQMLIGDMTTTSWVLTGVFAAAGVGVLAAASPDDAERLGDALQYILPAGAYTMTWIGRDGRGAIEYSLQLGTGTALTYGLKQAVSKRTPTAADFDSFPSAHTQAAFSGASFIHRRYGPRWAVPAYVLAA
jgi:hypothetical protein